MLHDFCLIFENIKKSTCNIFKKGETLFLPVGTNSHKRRVQKSNVPVCAAKAQCKMQHLNGKSENKFIKYRACRHKYSIAATAVLASTHKMFALKYPPFPFLYIHLHRRMNWLFTNQKDQTDQAVPQTNSTIQKIPQGRYRKNGSF